MQLTSYLEAGRLTVALTGEIDHHRKRDISRRLQEKLRHIPQMSVFWIFKRSVLWIPRELPLSSMHCAQWRISRVSWN